MVPGPLQGVCTRVIADDSRNLCIGDLSLVHGIQDGLEKFRDKEDYYVFHSGTKFNGQGQIVTNGGRVLGVTANGATVKEARENAYKAVKEISFANKYYRTDIARAVDEV